MLKATCGRDNGRREDRQEQSDGAVVSLPHRDGNARGELDGWVLGPRVGEVS